MTATAAAKKEESGSAVWLAEVGKSLTLLGKSRTILKSLEAKLAEDAKFKSNFNQKDFDALNSKIETIEKEKKELESKNHKLANEVSSLRAEEGKQNEIRKLNKELQQQLEVKKSEYEVSINEHARTKLANEDIRQKNNELYEKISDLKKELEKARDSRGRGTSRSVRSSRGKRSPSRSVKRSRSGSIRRKRSRTRSRSHSVKRSVSLRKRSRTNSIRKTRSRSRGSSKRRGTASLKVSIKNRSLSPSPRRSNRRDRSRSRSRSPDRRNTKSEDSYAELKRRRRLSSGRRDSSFRRSPRR